MNKKPYLRGLDSRRNGLEPTSIPRPAVATSNAKVVGAIVITGVPDVLVAAVADIFAAVVVILMLIYEV